MEDVHDISNYRPICLLSAVFKVIPNRISRTLDKGQSCEQSGIRSGISTIDNMHTVTNLTEVSRECKVLLFLTLTDMKKAFHQLK